MPLLDWFRGRGAGGAPEGDSRAPEADRMEARRNVQEAAASPSGQPGTAEEAADAAPREDATREGEN